MRDGDLVVRLASTQTVRLDGEEFLLIELRLPRPEIPARLSPGERAVVELLLDGLSAREIARARGTSVNTVRSQIRSIHTKLGVSNLVELARVCFSGARGRSP